MSDLDDILSDAHVAPSFKRALTTPHEFLIKVHAKQERRRFLQEPEVPTHFGTFECPLRVEPVAADADLAMGALG